jgi:hypothetical protein
LGYASRKITKGYEHIIRDEVDLDRIRNYIQSNPANWDEDEENPDHTERTFIVLS